MWDGFRQAFEHALEGRKARQRVVLIGARARARSGAFFLADLGVELAIVNRSKANAVALADELARGAEIANLEHLPALAEKADIVVNSASLGHAGASLPAAAGWKWPSLFRHDLRQGGGRAFLERREPPAGRRMTGCACWSVSDARRSASGSR